MRRILAALLACLLMTGACAMAEEEAPELLEPVGVQLDSAPVVRGELYQLTLYEGEVGCEVEELSFEVTGTILSIDTSYGAEVKKGDVLATLDDSNYVKETESLERQLAYLLKNNEYVNRMAELDIRIAEAELRAIDDPVQVREKKAEIDRLNTELKQNEELQQIDVEATQAQLDAAKAKLGKNQIVAPFDGQVVYLSDALEGDGVQAFQTLICLADRTRPKITTEYLSEVYLSGAHACYAMIGDKTYDVTLVPPDMSKNITKSLMGVELTSEFTIDHADEDIRVGDYAAVCLVTRYVEDTLSIPINALYSDSQGRYVYLLVDGVRVRQNVTTGILTELRAEIKDGLKEGDYVYVKE